MMSIAMPAWIQQIDTVVQQFPYRKGDHIDSQARVVSDIVVAHTNPDDKIIVCGNWNLIYNLTDRFAVSKFSYQNAPASVDSNIMDQFCQEIDTDELKLAVILENSTVYGRAMEIVSKNELTEIYNKEGIHIFLIKSENYR